MLSGEYPLNAAKDHIQMNEKVSKHIFELDQSRGQYSEAACDIVRKLLRKDPQRRLQSLNNVRKEAFFQSEIEYFTEKTLRDEKKVLSKNEDYRSDLNEAEKRSVVSENFWNPYVIMENYSPLQMLFDEIYTLKQKQQQQQQRGLEIPPRKSKGQIKNSNLASLPPPPPPPPPPPAQAYYDENNKISHFNEPNINNAFDDDSSTSTISSQKSDECNLAYKSPYIDDYEEDDEVQDYNVKTIDNTDEHFAKF